MHVSTFSVQLIREKSPRPRRIRSLWLTINPGSVIEVENNRQRERGFAEWMRCRVYRLTGNQLWVIPVSQ